VGGGEIKVGCTYLSRGSQGGYECGGHHAWWALDLIAGTGTSIYAAGAGYAKNVTGQSGYSGYGNVVVVDHGNNVKSLYAHMNRSFVNATGAWVDQNTVIGQVGSTGTSSTPHLHYEATSSGRFQTGSRDPGPLKACHGSQLLRYPQAWGLSTWQGIPWGTRSVYSDGTGCESAQPFGSFDTVSPAQNGVAVSGWALDPDATGPIDVHVYVNGAFATATSANLSRPDVEAAFGKGPNHGFSVLVPTGGGNVCAFALNYGGGTNILLGCKNP